MTIHTGDDAAEAGNVKIYVLIDPRNSAARYVGKTKLPLSRRLRRHICRTNLTPKRHSSRWIAGLMKAGHEPAIEELETVPAGSDWQEAERFWIEYFRFIGADLTNLAVGGEGVGGVRMTEERKRHLSETFKGRVFDDEWRRKISKAKLEQGSRPPRDAETERKRAASIRAAMIAKSNARTHCRRGHEYTTENTLSRKGGRECRQCIRESNLRSFHRCRGPLVTPEEHARRTREAMQRPDVRERYLAAMAKRKQAAQANSEVDQP